MERSDEGGSQLKIPITKPFFDKAEEKAVTQVLRSGWVTQGPKVTEFEEAICRYTGAKYAVATTSATTALFLSLHLLEIGPGDEVIVPSHTFIATANVILQVGATPIFVDIDLKTYNIDPDKIEEKITKKTKAILPVDQVGLPCDLNKIMALAKKYNLIVLEDAACALGSSYMGKKIGTLANMTCFSFHPRKSITTGEGGMILTKNKNWAVRAKILRHQGMGISDYARHGSNRVIHENYPEIGFNFRMSDIQAAVGVEQMKKLNKLLAKRNKIAQKYNRAFTNSHLIVTPATPKGYFPNWQSYIIRLKRNNKVSRDQLMQRLLDKGIATRRGIMSIHLEKPYIKLFGKLNLSNSEEMTNWGITLPLYPQMTRDEQDFVITNIKQVLGENN